MKKESKAKYECTGLHNIRGELKFKSAASEWLKYKTSAVKESTMAQYRNIFTQQQNMHGLIRR